MHKVIRSALASLFVAFVCLSVFYSTEQAFADDTEIFFVSPEAANAANPNILFILDTSGSMGWDNPTRLEQMQSALTSFLRNAQDVNVGFMRFNSFNGGGAVVYPVADLDQEICPYGDCGVLKASTTISSSMGDAYEITSSRLAGSVKGTSNHVYIGQDTRRRTTLAGLHFDDLSIPQGATIDAAHLVLTASGTERNPPQITVSIENSPDATLFDSIDANLSNRIRAANRVNWQPESWDRNQTIQSVDLGSLIQQVVNRSDWCSGASVNLLIEASDFLPFYAYDLKPESAARLEISYSISRDSGSTPANNCGKRTLTTHVSNSSDDAFETLSNNRMNTTSGTALLAQSNSRKPVPYQVGFIFRDIDIPSDATLTGAWLEFSAAANDSKPVSLSVHAEQSIQPPAFSKGKKDISNRTLLAKSVSWNDVASTSNRGSLISPDLTELIQQIINQPEWVAGKSIGLHIKHLSGTGSRKIRTKNGSTSAPPKLIIEFEAAPENANPSEVTPSTKVREHLIELSSNIGIGGSTPTVDALYEAALYLTGQPVDFGTQRGVRKTTYHRVSHPESYHGGTLERKETCTDANLDHSSCLSETITNKPDAPIYVSPIQSSCQPTHIVLLSDGAANNLAAENRIRSMIGVKHCQKDGHNTCGIELADWMANSDVLPSLAGQQNIFLHTVGFNHTDRFLEDLARAGRGSYYTADDTSTLISAFSSILEDVADSSNTFSTAGVSLSTSNRLTHDNALYLAMFQPALSPRWQGNLKKYKAGINSNGRVVIRDANGNPAIDSTTGQFMEDSQSYWSGKSDGADITRGGAAEQIHYAAGTERPLYTLTSANNPRNGQGSRIIHQSNLIHESNTNITSDMLGLSGSTQRSEGDRQTLLAWARGLDVRDDNDNGVRNEWRKSIGDPLHSTPLVVTHAEGSGDNTTVFFGTNDGVLHAIDSKSGKERFAFMPPDLLPLISKGFQNDPAEQKIYGLDGPLTLHHDDTNNNGKIDNTETAILYIGMRRGGRNYYALNITDLTDPRLLWSLKGGDTANADYNELGETWSEPKVTTLTINKTDRDVLIFGAGYDNRADKATTHGLPETHTMGRGFFVVDAMTGKRLWSASAPGTTASQTYGAMQYSVPSALNLLDVDQDGRVDQIWFGDTGGQLWRFDVNTDDKSNELFVGGIVASVSGNSASEHRKFFYSPDIALINDAGQAYLSVAIGSGWRSHPLDSVTDDMFFVLKQTPIHGAPAGYGKQLSDNTYGPLSLTDLQDVSNETTLSLSSGNGWYIDFTRTGEKVLASSTTLDYRVVFTTYRPDQTAGACQASPGTSAIYSLNLLDAEASTDLNKSGDIDKNDTHIDLEQPGIAPEPVVLLVEENGQVKPTILVGVDQPVDAPPLSLTQRTFWIEVPSATIDTLGD